MNLKRIGILAGAALSAAALSVANSTAASASGYGHIWNNSPSVNECLAAAGNVNGAVTIMWNCDAENGQQWAMVPVKSYNGTEYYTIRNLNGGCLDLNSSSEGSQIMTNPCVSDPWGDTGAAQLWNMNAPSGGMTELVNSRVGQCLSVAGGSTANGANVIIWACQGTADQYWGGNIA